MIEEQYEEDQSCATVIVCDELVAVTVCEDCDRD